MSFAKHRFLLNVDVDIVWRTLKTRKKYGPCCQTKNIERLETLEILERSNVLGDKRFVEENGRGNDDEEDLEVLAYI
jgi:hypothetical protein